MNRSLLKWKHLGFAEVIVINAFSWDSWFLSINQQWKQARHNMLLLWASSAKSNREVWAWDTWKIFAYSWGEKNLNQNSILSHATDIKKQSWSCLCLKFAVRVSHFWLRWLSRCILRCGLSKLYIPPLSPCKKYILVSKLLKSKCIGEPSVWQATCMSDKAIGCWLWSLTSY